MSTCHSRMLTSVVGLATCVFNMFPWTPDAEMSTPHQEYAHFVYSDPILYHVTLQLGAIQLEKEKHQKGLRQSKQLMAECLRMLRERIAHFTETGEAVDDQTICAVASLAAIEVTTPYGTKICRMLTLYSTKRAM